MPQQEVVFPASFAQQRLWFLDQLEPGSPLYNIPKAFRLRGELRPAALARALRDIRQRHEVLRTTFAEEGGAVVQIVAAAESVAGWTLPVVDLSSLPPGAAEEVVAEIVREEALRPFDLSRGPLLRAMLLRLGAADSVLLLNLHHTIADGWSLKLFLGELEERYEAHLGGRPGPPKELAIQYGDFAAWQREWLDGETLEAQLDYWRAQLGDAPALLELPMARPRSAERSGRGGAVSAELPRSLREALDALARSRRSSRFMVLLAAFKALLHRHTNQGDLVVGTPIANRSQEQIEGLIGLFVNTLPLRTVLSDDPTFGELLERVRQVCLDAYAHQDLPFERLVEELAPARSLDHDPVVQVILGVEDTALDELELAGVRVDAVEIPRGPPKFELALSFRETATGLRCRADYSRDLFEAPAVARLLGHLRTLLEQVVADPDRRLSQLDLLGTAERHLLLCEWNDTGAPDPPDDLLHQPFERQVERTPDAVALLFEGATWSYRELDRSANRLAHHLRGLGVGPEVPVGVCLDRSPSMVVALLGILKAGGAYVPLDAAYPAERLALIVDDIRTGRDLQLVITERRWLSSLPQPLDDRRVRPVLLDREAEAIGRMTGEAAPSGAGAENLAYVIYTSGSTGKPKGVAIEHRSAVALVDWALGVFSPAELASVLGSTSINFDLSVYELFVTLAAGGRVVLVADALELADLDAEVTLVNTVPSAMAELLQIGGLPPSVKTVNLAGEPLKRSLTERIHSGPGGDPGRRVYNLYGPSEDTTYSTFSPIAPGEPDEPSIGKPIDRTRAYVVDRDLRLAAVGIAGELCLAGAGLVRGYLHRPRQTAATFVPDPFSELPGERLYRTGDLARWRADGTLEFLGRIDHQVKLRGYRIELGEIEVHLERHPAVGNAVAVVREDSPGDRRLVAYLEPGEGQGASDEELREHLRQTLPDYMVPAAFVALESLPRTPNGKVDRRALPAPEWRRSDAAAALVAPRDPLEELVAGTFSEVLGVSPIGVHDNFFELGGHSLLATQVVSRLRRICRVELPLRRIFEAPTVAELAGDLATREHPAESAGAAEITPLPRDRELPASFAQERLWFLDQLETDRSTYNVPAALHLEGELDATVLAAALDEVVRRHEALRTTLEAAGSRVLQRVTDEPRPAMPTVDLTTLSEARRRSEAGRLATEEAHRAFDLARGPLLRATLLRLAADDHVLLLTLHHIVSDGWSIGILLRELAALYEAFLRGEPSPLPELPLQYADFAAWQRQWLDGDVLESQLDYWRRQLDGVPTLLELPADKPRPPARSGRGGRQTLTLSEELGQQAREVAQEHGVSLFMLLLATFQTLLARYSGQTDIAVGAPIANRNRMETEGLIGFFVNTLVLRTSLAGDPTFAELLERVREVTLDAYAHQDLPFEKLVEELQPDRQLDRTPFFQAMFVLQSGADTAIGLPDVRVAPFEVELETAKFDLTLACSERQDGLKLKAEYSRDLFTAATAERMLGHFETLLEGAVAEPDARLSELELLADAERRRLLCGWNETASEYPREDSIVDLFERQVELRRESVAVVLAGGDGRSVELTYGELDARANQLAHHLRRCGVGPETLVGICMERSLELIVGLVGILKAGGAYLPLDPAYPRERIGFLLEDGQLPMVVAQSHLLPRLPEETLTRLGTEVICPDRDAEWLAAEPRDSPAPATDPDQLAYVLYTSGSTGRPKGVAVEHRSVVRLVRGASYIEFGPDEVYLQLAPVSFDASTLEIWGSLLNGARLVVCGSQQPSLEELGEVLRGQAVSTLWLTSGLFHQMVEAQPEALAGVRQLLAGGDVLSVPHCRRVLAERGAGVLVNGYGPTENTTFTTCHVMRAEDPIGESVPIGRPISNTRVYLLDRRLRPVPAGVAGELYAAGDGLARGYLGRPGRTAESFVPNPLGGDGVAEPGERLYRTGDLARWRHDGTLEFLGRIDHQVKLRGYRIEPGEVEGALQAHPGVAEAVVALQEAAPGDRRLVAYVVVRPGATADGEELRRECRRRLPDYMVPSAVVTLESFPLTPNGKVDRRALPAHEWRRSGEAAVLVAPRDPLEELVAGIFSEVLGVSPIGVHDNFFELGGHSLLATQVVSRLRRICRVELPLRRIFEAPTVAQLTPHVANRAEPAPEAEAMRLPRGQNLPASFAQERLWFLDQFEVDRSTYNVPARYRLAGELDVGILAAALDEVVRRHEALRTSFASAPEGVVQVIAPPASIPLPVVDLSALPDAARSAELHRLAVDEAHRPFDLARGPLLRATLLRLAGDEHFLLLSLHHIVSDGWSMDILLRELATLYRALTHGEPSPLPELALQYADFAAWQRRWLTGDVLERQLGYWRRRLDGAPSLLELPTDRPRLPTLSGRGGQQALALSEELGRQARTVAREHGVSLFMLLLAAFQTLLARYSGQTDIAVGAPIANRNRMETEGLIGFFVNTLVLRTSLAGDPTFAELLERVREVTLDAYAHQDLPFEKLVEELQPDRNLSHSPLFQVMLVVQDEAETAIDLPGVRVTPFHVELDTAKFDLTLACSAGEDGLKVQAEYSSDLFEAATVARLLGHLENLLEQVVADPSRRLSSLDLAGAAERHLLVSEWNQTAVESPRERTIAELFERQVERTPDADALLFEDSAWTYRELDRRANHLARSLRGLGVGPEVPVGVYLDPSPELVVAVLGILKAGGAYVPLDPDHPADRLEYMLRDSAASIVVTLAALRRRVPTGAGDKQQIVALERDLPEIERAADPPLRPAASDPGRNLVYVLYTSGSTGRPKGVLLEQRSLVNRLLWQIRKYAITSEDRVVQKTPLSFDVAGWELYCPLLCGAKLVLLPPGKHRDPAFLRDFIREQKITLADFVPTMLNAFLRVDRVEECTTLRQVFCGGEAMTPALIELFHQKLPGVELDNVYGPTETAIDLTSWRCRPGADVAPIGKPISNIRLFIFDASQRLCPVGIPGELYAAGVGLARGYLGRPGRTAECFVPNPLGGEEGGEPGERLYRTGDLARWRADGTLEFLGRIDHQVKLRGYRIELGEIEVHLERHPAVGNAVAVVREDSPGDRRLVAYLEPGEGQRPSDEELREHLWQTLPDYMVPAAFVALESLPRTPNGKVDRRALPAPEWRRSDAAAALVAPRDPLEELVAGTFSEVLGVSPIGVHDNFFELGGHSLLATQVVSRLRRICRVELPLRRIFEAPTVAELAGDLATREHPAESAGAAEITPVPRDRELPASFAQERLWFLDRLGVDEAAYNVPARYRLAGELDSGVLAAALTEVVRRHEALRTCFASGSEGVVQIIAPAGSTPLPVVDLRALPDAARSTELHRLAAEEGHRPFDLARGPLLRATLLRLAADDHVLLLTLHHIVSDAWSMDILLRELATLYEAFLRGEPSPLSEPALQYADFAAWQRQWLTGEVLERQLDYWRQQLDGAPSLLELPLDHPRPAVQSFRGDRRLVELPAELAAGLHTLAREHGVSLFMLLLAAVQVLLARYSGQTDVPVGAPIANRNRMETEGLIGFFVNTLVLRTSLAGDPTFADLLERVRKVALDAYAHQDLPFEKLVEELQPERNLSHSPLFQVMLLVQGEAETEIELPGVRVTPFQVEADTAKFDLLLAFEETSAGFCCLAEYNRDLFDPPTVARLLGHLETLLEQVVADPGRRLSRLDLLGTAERHLLLSEWNDTRATYPRDDLLHQPFERQVERTPDAVALLFDDSAWTYRELDRRANRLAHRLKDRGVGPGTLVGVHLGRSPTMVAALLGILKAGGAYVPLETNWPPDRLHLILASEEISHLVTEAARLETLEAHAPLQSLDCVICLDRAARGSFATDVELVGFDDRESAPNGRPPAAATAGDLAYIIFTSGSTGRPKGVMVRHRPAVNLVHWVNHTFRIDSSDRLLFVTALSFDLSVYDIFGILSAGGSVRIASRTELRDPRRLVQILCEEPITFWDSAPAALQQLAPFFAEAESRPAPPALRLVFLSGDWIPVSLPDRIRRSFGGADVISLGGATEATVWSNFYPIDRVDPEWTSIPYGRPIENASYYVLDGHLRPVPIGVPGDLYIGGECLSSGYFNEPRLTAAQFVPSPFGGRPGERLYRTGDRARYRADGNLEFLGRLDTQVKVRGFRIELGEIESVLGGHPEVREAVVLAREDRPGDQRLVAYVIPSGSPAPEIAELRGFAQAKLPEYMVPTAFVFLESWPLAPAGKLDRKALPAPEAARRPRKAAAEDVPASELERQIAAIWADVIGLEEVGTQDSFFDLGGHSLLMLRVHARLEELTGHEIAMVDLFRHPTVASLAEHLSTETPEEPRPAPVAAAAARGPAEDSRIAIVGMAGRFPGAPDVETFWENLRDGVESIRFFSDRELLDAGFEPHLLEDPKLVKARGALDDPDLFDADFFGVPPREAQVLDPQHRVFLETAWEALEVAGYGADDSDRAVGVFGGVTESTYLRAVLRDPHLVRTAGRLQISIGNNPDYLPTRVSYKLNLTGPSINVQTACSTSLVAVHLACRSLQAGECDLALAGGVSIQAQEILPYRYEEGGISSPDGHTRTFDAAAAGVVNGSGAGIVVLKRLSEAVADRDTIQAVILGTAINNDGAFKVGFTAPSARGQAEVIRQAHRRAGVDPSTITYVETHGTATPIGDPIEIAGLAQAYGVNGARRSVALGSVKTNIGHLDAAAGVAGLIKTVQALEHREIPPSLHFTEPNPEIDFDSGPFYVTTDLESWETNDHPRRAGVSSFGIGGTNAHVVLEEAPPLERSGESRPAQLLLLSARTPAALDSAVGRLADHLERCEETDLADAAYTLQVGRKAFAHRRAAVAGDRPQAIAALRSADPRWARSVDRPNAEHPVVFLMPGQGAQHVGMGKDLYELEPAYRTAFDRCAKLLRPHLAIDLREVLFATGDRIEEAQRRLRRTELTQPALFALEYALAQLWLEWGVRPQAMLGHSVGEYVAACLAGVFSLADGLRLIAVRGRLMQSLPGGAMLAVALGEEAVLAAIEACGFELALAAVNGPAATVVSGEEAAVAALAGLLEKREIAFRRLETSHAFHSPMMAPVADRFAAEVLQVELAAPRIPYVSNVSGRWVEDSEATDPAYWTRHLLQTVRFADGLEELLAEPGRVLVEVGPGRTLSNLSRRSPSAAAAALVTPSLSSPPASRPDHESLLEALGRLWLAGVEIDWRGFHRHETRRRVGLPTYPFERRRHWVDGSSRPSVTAVPSPPPATAVPSLAARGSAEADAPLPSPAVAVPVEEHSLSPVELQVAAVWKDQLGVESVGPDDDFFDLGGSSLLAIQLGSRLRESFGVELSSDFLLLAPTLRTLAELVERQAAGEGPGESEARSCLVPLQNGGSRPPLFLAHQVGGHVYSFRSLCRALGPDQPVYGLRSRGLMAGEEPFERIEQMAAHYLELVREVQPSGAYRIGGASMGGMVAFEMARQLRAAREEISLLVLMDTPCLDEMPPRPEEDGEFVAGVFAGQTPLTREELEGLDAEQQLAFAVDKARQAGAEIDLDEARRLYRVMKGNVTGLFEYRPEPLEEQMLFFRARERRPLDPERPEIAWIPLALRGIEIHLVPGNHETMHEPPHVEEVAARLAAALERA